MKNDGQWNPIIVRPSEDGGYEIISGHYRFQAAKELGWKEVEATVKDLSDEEADFLALKTNLVRANMSEMEEGKVIQKTMKKYNLSQRQVADKLGKSRNWVERRMSLVLKIIGEVQEALSSGDISMDHAYLISQINKDKFDNWEDKQREFLNLIIKYKWTRDDTRIQLKRFFNTTIYTIGYEGREIDDFIEILKKNEIVILLDVRKSAESKHKPEFNGKILARSLKQNNIKYEHHPGFGIPYELQEPYKDGDFSFECLEQWYRWHIKKNIEFTEFVEHIKDIGKSAIMCMEKYAKAQRDQKYHCHRHILANIINETQLFQERMDL